MSKEVYERPQVEELGSFEALTQSTDYGYTLDANFYGPGQTGDDVHGMLS